MKARKLPTKEELGKFFLYNHTTGGLITKERLSKKTLAGQVLSCRNKKGYIHFNLFGKFYYTHRVIWKMVTGEEPDIIDHINGVKDDNRFENLRSVTTSQNNLNHKDAKGYYVCNKTGKFVVEVQGKTLGRFTDKEKAREVYFEKREELLSL